MHSTQSFCLLWFFFLILFLKNTFVNECRPYCIYRKFMCVSVKFHGCFVETVVQTSLGSFSICAFNLLYFLYDTIFQCFYIGL